MPLLRLETFQFRNLNNPRIDLDAGLQFIYGPNASGKTSLLDAIHVLSSAKSFLGASPRKLQQYATTDFSINGLIDQQDFSRRPIQFRWQDGTVRLSVASEVVKRSSDYANIQPVQAVTPLSYRLLDDAPDIRRRFMDWGVFHVKHGYSEIWRRFQRSLSQRNAMLGSGVDSRTLAAWSEEYVSLSHKLDKFRSAYIEKLTPLVVKYFNALLPDNELQIRYLRGWDQMSDLSQLLYDTYQRDNERKFTYYGPQRADLNLKLNGVLAKDSASRGQKKLITFALYLAQASMQQQLGNHSGIFIVDDLPSELDHEHVSLVMDILRQIPMQTFISCIDISQLPEQHRHANKMFHVKQGEVKEVVQ